VNLLALPPKFFGGNHGRSHLQDAAQPIQATRYQATQESRDAPAKTGGRFMNKGNGHVLIDN